MLPKRPIRLTLDFDGTLTEHDTLSALIGTCYDFQRRRGCKPSQTLERIVSAYTKDFERHIESYRPSVDERKTVQEEFQWLESLRDVEQASIMRVVQAGVFVDADQRVLEEAAHQALEKGEIVPRPGWIPVCEKVFDWNKTQFSDKSGGVSILSVNWSTAWVSACLDRTAQQTRERSALNTVGKIYIYANEVASVDGSKVSRRWLDETAPYITATDKLQHMQYHASVDDKDKEKPIQIYIGDSATDLAALVNADIGICMRDAKVTSGEADLEETCSRIGIEVKDIADYPSQLESDSDHTENSAPRPLWTTTSFLEVEKLLNRLC